MFAFIRTIDEANLHQLLLPPMNLYRRVYLRYWTIVQTHRNAKYLEFLRFVSIPNPLCLLLHAATTAAALVLIFIIMNPLVVLMIGIIIMENFILTLR